MITEDYVSFETAKLFREKGFYGDCFSMYVTPKPHSGMGNPNEAKIAPHGRDSHYYEGYEYQCEAPTLQMAMKWLREKHYIFIDIISRFSMNADKDVCFSYSCKKLIGTYKSSYEYNDGEWLNYKEAAEAAINYCLEKLV